MRIIGTIDWGWWSSRINPFAAISMHTRKR